MDKANRITIAQLPATVDHLLTTAFHLRIFPLDRGKIEICLPLAGTHGGGGATGSGGEIRDEGATGRGAKPKAGLTGFSVSNLRIPGYEQPWEVEFGKPDRIVSALDIMIEGPLGGASFNNEFGRPNLCGYFRTYEAKVNGPPEPVAAPG
jgi:hypothetical protein